MGELQVLQRSEVGVERADQSGNGLQFISCMFAIQDGDVALR